MDAAQKSLVWLLNKPSASTVVSLGLVFHIVYVGISASLPITKQTVGVVCLSSDSKVLQLLQCFFKTDFKLQTALEMALSHQTTIYTYTAPTAVSIYHS